MTAELEEKLGRLAAVERELAGLVVRHEFAMSAFKFDEAREVQQEIAVLEHEKGELVAALPAPIEPPPPTDQAVRVRRRRLAQGRRRPLRR
jgi:hypothetical protein